MSKKKIVVVPPSKRPDGTSLNEEKKYRVAAYARVSTDHDDQMNSLELQMTFFSEYIRTNPNWILVKVYADEGISGLSRKKRKNFNQMVEDAKNGMIDIILSKSISRFARNVIDTLTVVRELKDHDVYVYFQKENINTQDPNGEFLLNFMASFAEEESKSISSNIRWAKKRIIKEGKVSIPYSSVMGYKKGEHKYEMVIDKEQAPIIRLIYRRFLNGYSANSIVNYLNEHNIPSPMNKTWNKSVVDSILSNEKYCGDAVLQKTYVSDIFTKKEKKNDNVMDKVFVYDDHPAIIKRDTFNEVQEQKTIRKYFNSQWLTYSGKLYCTKCESFYRRRFWYHDYYDQPKNQWVCSQKYTSIRCGNVVLLEDELNYALSQVLEDLKKDYSFVFNDLKDLVNKNIKDTQRKEKIIKEIDNTELSKDAEMNDIFYRIIIKRISVFEERVLKFFIADGTIITYRMPKWSVKYCKPYTGSRPVTIKNPQSKKTED